MAGKYPEHERMAAVKGRSQVIGEFLDWLSGRGTVLAEWSHETCIGADGKERVGTEDLLFPVHRSIQQWLADYFEIDPVLIEKEKRAMIDEIRAPNRHD